MPYDNKINRMIAEKLHQIYLKNIEHYEKEAEGLGDNQRFARVVVGNAKKTYITPYNIVNEQAKIQDLEDGKDDYDSEDEEILEPNQYKSQDTEAEKKHKIDAGHEKDDINIKRQGGNKRVVGGALGGISGFSKGTVRDEGEEKQLGAGMSGGKPLRPFIKSIKRRSKIANPLDILHKMTGIAQKLNIPVVSDVASKINKGTSILKELMPEKKKEEKEEKEEDKKGKGKDKDLLLKRPKEGSGRHSKNIGVLKKRGRPSKMGGAESLARPYNMVNKRDMTGNGIKPEQEMKGSTVSGMGKGKKKSRAEIVKEIMKTRGLSMTGASKYVKEHNLYKK